MKLKDILEEVEILQRINYNNFEIHKITFDSRDIEDNTLFVAIRGVTLDGHNFIDEAVNNGAKVVVCQELPREVGSGVVYIKVEDTTRVLSKIASNFYRNPSKRLNVIGVTGTNGKTTVATLLYELFSSMGENCGLISTINIRILDREIEATHTTPDVITLNRLFRQMIDGGCKYCFMEVSSHGISQGRINGINFKGGIFTNITHDHLDYHKTFKNYIQSKKEFFNLLPKNSFAISNYDDKNGEIMLQNTKADKYSYSLKSGSSNFRAKIVESDIGMQHIVLDGKQFYTPLSGEFNVYNLLAIYAVAVLCKKDRDDILVNLSKLNGVKGRFETFISKRGRRIIIDYAHTPDALESILSTINKIKNNSKVITVIGCGGDRDREKRAIMGRVATEKSDEVILTSDNPRFENPRDILRDMEKGISDQNFQKYAVIEDRKEAIKMACKISDEKSIILIAGKGHETYQDIRGKKQHFNDMEEVKYILEKFNL